MSGLSPYSTALATASKPISTWLIWFVRGLSVATVFVVASCALVAIVSAILGWPEAYAFQLMHICTRAIIVVFGLWALLLGGVVIYFLFKKWGD